MSEEQAEFEVLEAHLERPGHCNFGILIVGSLSPSGVPSPKTVLQIRVILFSLARTLKLDTKEKGVSVSYRVDS